jgi:cation diffusion facilitator CzcD-associated flavoprotein CzcO
VFQRTPNWCAPLLNAKIGKEEMARIRARYGDIFARCQETFGCFLHTADPRNTFDVTPEEREAFWEKLYNEPGFGIWVGNFMDMLTNREANAAMSEFVARKIRQRVHNPEVAEKLIPKNHGFGTRRVPLETRYYEVYNQPNVRLVDINETPIERITESGIRTSAENFDFDMIIYATGFDALTGSFDRIDIRGTGGRTLREAWKDGPQSFVGMQVAGFPNMLMLLGPHTALGNIPRSIEYNVEWVADFLKHLHAHNLTRAEPTEQAQAEWLEVVKASAKGLLSNEVSSWFTGVNTNIEGRDRRMLFRYSGSAPDYRRRCDAVAQGGYREIMLA